MMLIIFVIGVVMLLWMLEEYLLVGDDVEYGEEVYVLWGDGEKFDVSWYVFGNVLDGLYDVE